MAKKQIKEDINVDGNVTGTSINNTSLAPGRVVISGQNGKEQDNVSLTYNTTTGTLSAPKITGDGSAMRPGPIAQMLMLMGG